MGLSQKDQTKHNTLLRLGTQSVKMSYPKTGYRVSQVQPHILTPGHDNRHDEAMLAGPRTRCSNGETAPCENTQIPVVTYPQKGDPEEGKTPNCTMLTPSLAVDRACLTG